MEDNVLVDPPTLSVAKLPKVNTRFHGTEEVPDRLVQTSLELREGIQHLTGGVTVVTSGDNAGAWYGVTSTSVSTLSMEPPVLITCLPRRSRIGQELGRTQRFCVNVLAQHQREVAVAFADLRSVDAHRFRYGVWTSGTTASPVLENALASLECAVDLIYAYPNHLVVIGTVQHVTQDSGATDPLVYVSEQFGYVKPIDTVMAAAR